MLTLFSRQFQNFFKFSPNEVIWLTVHAYVQPTRERIVEQLQTQLELLKFLTTTHTLKVFFWVQSRFSTGRPFPSQYTTPYYTHTFFFHPFPFPSPPPTHQFYNSSLRSLYSIFLPLYKGMTSSVICYNYRSDLFWGDSRRSLSISNLSGVASQLENFLALQFIFQHANVFHLLDFKASSFPQFRTFRDPVLSTSMSLFIDL